MKKIKIITILVLILILLNNIANIVYARPTDDYDRRDTVVNRHTAGEIIDEAGKFIKAGEEGADAKIDPTDLKNMSDTLYNILLVVGIVIAIIIGLIMAIKFILGSLEEKAEIKAMLIPYIIGCVIVFGAFGIWQMVVNLLQSM